MLPAAVGRLERGPFACAGGGREQVSGDGERSLDGDEASVSWVCGDGFRCGLDVGEGGAVDGDVDGGVVGLGDGGDAGGGVLCGWLVGDLQAELSAELSCDGGVGVHEASRSSVWVGSPGLRVMVCVRMA